jgi:pimeloyl-ACP methyl ester carboxylesterase
MPDRRRGERSSVASPPRTYPHVRNLGPQHRRARQELQGDRGRCARPWFHQAAAFGCGGPGGQDPASRCPDRHPAARAPGDLRQFLWRVDRRQPGAASARQDRSPDHQRQRLGLQYRGSACLVHGPHSRQLSADSRGQLARDVAATPGRDRLRRGQRALRTACGIASLLRAALGGALLGRDGRGHAEAGAVQAVSDPGSPTLVVWGRNDKGGIYESAVAAVARMPRADLVAFDNCGHLPMLEHADRYNSLVRDFLTWSPPARSIGS